MLRFATAGASGVIAGTILQGGTPAAELELTKDEIAEIEYRFEALKPYQKPGSPNLAPTGSAAHSSV